MRDLECLTRFPPTNTKRSEVVVTKAVFGIKVRHCAESVCSAIETKPRKTIGNESVAVKIRDPKTVTVMDSFVST